MSVSCGRDTGGARGSPAPVEATADTLQQEGDLAAVFLFRRILFGRTCHLLCPWRPFIMGLFYETFLEW